MVQEDPGEAILLRPWDDTDGALKKYLEQKDALHVGRKPREDTEGLTVKQRPARQRLKPGLMQTPSWDPRIRR
jgi:hypothetical protein